MTKTDMTLNELQKHLNKTCQERGWDQRSLTECFMMFTEEVGELAKAIRKVNGIQVEAGTEQEANLHHEFADVLNYLMELANRFDVDLTRAYFEKHDINQRRTWN